MIIDTISLKRLKTSENSFVPLVDILVDDIDTTCILDTGAASTSLKDDPRFNKYISAGQKDMKGASGKSLSVDRITPKFIQIGKQRITSKTLERAHQGFLGLDLLSHFIFEIDLANNKINFLSEFPENLIKQPLHILDSGHITVDLLIGDNKKSALFDTGADTNIFDESFVNSKKFLFNLLREEQGTDSTGNTINSQIFNCTSLSVGNKIFKNTDCAVFKFNKEMKEAMPNTDMILGSSIIKEFNWIFDIKNKVWAANQKENK